ncbi:MAG: hypothetical protein ACTSP2_06160 [Alphaproteobacteria bacterium]
MEITAWTVLFAAAVTAVMTGVGALPFAFVRHPGAALLGYSNALAAGLNARRGARRFARQHCEASSPACRSP